MSAAMCCTKNCHRSVHQSSTEELELFTAETCRQMSAQKAPNAAQAGYTLSPKYVAWIKAPNACTKALNRNLTF